MSLTFIIALIAAIIRGSTFVVPMPDAVRKVAALVFVVAAAIWGLLKYL